MNKKIRRGSAGRPLFCAAWIEDGDHGRLRTCTLSEIAEGGAKIHLETVEPVPNQFILRLAPDGSVVRECRVVSRNGQDIGVSFDTPLSEQTVMLAVDETNWTIE
jgi:hypothetical protein